MAGRTEYDGWRWVALSTKLGEYIVLKDPLVQGELPGTKAPPSTHMTI